jgi:hypothetical protein
MMQLKFLEVPPGGVQQELTQWDQFRTDELSAAEALVRESHQNSLDAGPSNGRGPVRTRISIVEPSPSDADYLRSLFAPLEPHLEACNRKLENPAAARFLVFEDFNTTGLVGSVNQTDDLNFSDFWRRVGRSHKGGVDAGSWGLGKLAFPASSTARCFFGVTIREGEQQPYFMGQAVLEYHALNGREYVPHGFFANHRADGFQLPVTDRAEIKRFSDTVGFRRTGEPGLSIAVPFVHHELREADLVPEIIKNYSFPILTGRLEVSIAGLTINADTFDEVAQSCGGEEFKGGALPKFIRDLNAAANETPDAEMRPIWRDNIDKGFDDAALKNLRERLAQGKLVHVRAPISLRRQSGAQENTHIDLFLRAAREGEQSQAIFVRGALTIPREARLYFRVRTAFGALIAQDGPAAEFLRNAENPAHTEWNGAGKLNDYWKNGSKRLREIRTSLRRLHDLLAQAVEQRNENALIDIFSVKDGGARDQDKLNSPIVRRKGPPKDIKRRPQQFTAERRKGGFLIRGGPDLRPENLPMKITVRAAYNVLRGNPFSKHSEYDFNFLNGIGAGTDFDLDQTAAEVRPVSANALEIEVSDQNFTVGISGFDQNRDLRLDIRRKAA